MNRDDNYPANTPYPGRFEALAGPWRVDYNDEYPDVYELSGTVAGEEDWDSVEAVNRAHLTLRRDAIERVPGMLAELTESLDLLEDDGESEDSAKRRGTLASEIRATLSYLDSRGRQYGLESFVVVFAGDDGVEPAEDHRYESVADADRRAEELNAAADEQERPFSVIPAKLAASPRGSRS